MLSPAVRYILIASLLFTVLNICVKYLPHIPATELVFFRGLVTFLISGGYLLKKKIPLLGNNRRVLLLRGFFGTVSLFALFFCLQRIPLAMASVLSNLAPLFTVLIAHLLLKERAQWMHAVLLAIAFAGVLLVKGWDPTVSWEMAGIGVVGAVAAACAYTSVRILRTTDHPMVVVFYFPFISIPMMIVPMWLEWVTPSARDALLILLIGVLTQAAQYFMTISYQLEKAAKIMVYNYAGVVWSIVFGAIVFREVFVDVQFLGVFLIFVAIVVSSLMERRAAPTKRISQ